MIVILAEPYTAHLRAEMNDCDPQSKSWWNLQNELDSAQVYRCEWEILKEEDGVATLKNGEGHRINVPMNCLAELPDVLPESQPQPELKPAFCLLPYPIGAVVKVLFVWMTIAEREPVKRIFCGAEVTTWQYKCKPVHEYERFWGHESGWYPHSYLEEV